MGILHIVGHVNFKIETFFPSALEAIKKASYFIAETPGKVANFLNTHFGRRDVTIVEFSARNLSHISPFELLVPVKERDAVLISDTGIPTVGDPGSIVVNAAHRMGIKVKPHPSPSPVLLTIAAAGIPSGRFMFYGYLPAKTDSAKKKLKNLIKACNEFSCAPVIIEAPHRVQATLELLINILPANFWLAVGINIMGKGEEIMVKPISEWRGTYQMPTLHKNLCTYVFWKE